MLSYGGPLQSSLTMNESLRPGFILSSFEFERNIWTHRFTSLWVARHQVTNVKVAIRAIQKSAFSTPEAEAKFRSEIGVLRTVDHPFIVGFFQDLENETHCFIVTEYVEGTTIHSYIATNGSISEDAARRYFAQLVSVLEYLHFEHKAVRLNFKSDHVLLDRYNNVRVLVDGLCSVENSTGGSKGAAYMAPEMVDGATYAPSMDVWNVGLILYEIVIGTLPFMDDNWQRLMHKIAYTEAVYPTYISQPLNDLLRKLTCKDPVNRVCTERIKNHPWFSQTEYQALLWKSKAGARHGMEGLSDKAIDVAVISDMTEMGIDCRALHSSLLGKEFTELTMLYKMLFREKMTEVMKDVIQKLTVASTSMAPAKMAMWASPSGGLTQRAAKLRALAPMPIMPSRIQRLPSSGSKPTVQLNMQSVISKAGINGSGTRRFSRPVASRPSATDAPT